MQAVFEKSGKRWVANLNVFWDLSVSTGPQGDNPSAFYIAEAVFDPIRVGGFVGGWLGGRVGGWVVGGGGGVVAGGEVVEGWGCGGGWWGCVVGGGGGGPGQ